MLRPVLEAVLNRLPGFVMVHLNLYNCEEGTFLLGKNEKFPTTDSISVRSLLECAHKCGIDNDCCGSSYEATDNECQLAIGSTCFGPTVSASGWTVAHKFPSTKQYFGDPKTWQDAQNQCIAWGGRLATASSYYEDEYMKDLTDRQTEVWIGGADLADEGNFTWRNPTQLISSFMQPSSGFTFWTYNNPNNYQNLDHCMTYYYYASTYLWADSHCTDLYAFICEK